MSESRVSPVGDSKIPFAIREDRRHTILIIIHMYALRLTTDHNDRSLCVSECRRPLVSFFFVVPNNNKKKGISLLHTTV